MFSKSVGRCSIARWQCNLRSMDVDNLPARLEALQHQRAAVENAGAVVEMKSCNGDVRREYLDAQVAGLQVHVWRLRLVPLCSDDPPGLGFGFSLCTERS